MPQQCSYPAKTKFDSTHVVVQGQAEQVCIVVRVCCVCGQWVQQKCLYYVPQLTVFALPSCSGCKGPGRGLRVT